MAKGVISVRIPDAVLSAAEKDAERLGVSRTDWIVDAMRARLEGEAAPVRAAPSIPADRKAAAKAALEQGERRAGLKGVLDSVPLGGGRTMPYQKGQTAAAKAAGKQKGR